MRGLVGFPLGIDQQRKRDAALVTKQLGVIQVTQSNRGQRGTRLPELVFVFAQLRDMLTAENSPIVPQEDNHGPVVRPQRSEPDLGATGFGQYNIRELAAK